MVGLAAGTAVVVLKPGHRLTAEELIAHCRRSLANYMIPRRIVFSDADLPKSGSGKILKLAYPSPSARDRGCHTGCVG
jgi:acyl-CoA synthetase (AMP-forming)/AMP-acid ligase II